MATKKRQRTGPSMIVTTRSAARATRMVELRRSNAAGLHIKNAVRNADKRRAIADSKYN